jgi:hypothetical protein
MIGITELSDAMLRIVEERRVVSAARDRWGRYEDQAGSLTRVAKNLVVASPPGSTLASPRPRLVFVEELHVIELNHIDSG